VGIDYKQMGGGAWSGCGGARLRAAALAGRLAGGGPKTATVH
jgi:hypothetical protein